MSNGFSRAFGFDIKRGKPQCKNRALYLCTDSSAAGRPWDGFWVSQHTESGKEEFDDI